jgi:hypothetical protein
MSDRVLAHASPALPSQNRPETSKPSLELAEIGVQRMPPERVARVGIPVGAHQPGHAAGGG